MSFRSTGAERVRRREELASRCPPTPASASSREPQARETSDARAELAQEGKGDAEHPTVIPMNQPWTPQAPSGAMTRVHARAIDLSLMSFNMNQ